MAYYMIDSRELKQKEINTEELYKVFDCTSYEDVRAEMRRKAYKEERLTDEFMEELRRIFWKNESPTRAMEIVEFLESNNLIRDEEVI